MTVSLPPPSAPAFAGDGHDRCAEHRTDEQWLADAWADSSTRVAVGSGDGLAVDGQQQPRWLAASAAPAGERYLLGRDDSGVRFAVSADEAGSWILAGLRELATVVDAAEARWLCHASALVQWHQTHRFCSRCGSSTQVAAAGAERRCTNDGSTHFPRVDPAVIMLVTDSADRVLLGRHTSWPAGRFSTLAGFVEPGESAEQAVQREVMEEAALAVDDVELLATQQWPFPSSLMIGATATSRGSSTVTPDGVELAETRWFSRDELSTALDAGQIRLSGSVSISRWLIERWRGAR